VGGGCYKDNMFMNVIDPVYRPIDQMKQKGM